MAVFLKIVAAAIVLNFLFLSIQHAEAGHDEGFKRQPECYCFDQVRKCEPAYFVTNKTWFRVDKMDPFLLMPNNEIQRLDDEGKMDQGKLYYLLPKNVTQEQLGLYGGWLRNYLKNGTQIVLTGYRNASEASMIMKVDGKTLFYHNTNKGRNTRFQPITFFKGNWFKLNENNENKNLVPATTGDIMTVLAGLEGVFIRSPYYNQAVDWTKFDMLFIYQKIEILGSSPDVLFTPPIGKCLYCGIGFVGNYCEKKNHFTHNPSLIQPEGIVHLN